MTRALPLAVATALGCAAGTRPTMPYAHHASVNGLHMYYEDRGAGRPLVLLHGGGSTAQTSFGAIIPSLARTHRVIAPEQQAHGHTGDIDRPASFEQLADDTAALLAELGLDDVDVAGFSSGGVVALQLAIRHPRLVRRLIVCSSFFARAGLPAALWDGMPHATMKEMPPALRDALLAAAPAAPEKMFARQVSLMMGFHDLPEAALHGIRAKTLIVVGDADIMPVEHAAQLARLVPGAQLAVMPGSGHGTYLGSAESAVPGSPLPALTVSMFESFLAGANDGGAR